MSSPFDNGGIIGPTQTYGGSGIWSLQSVIDFKKAPVVASGPYVVWAADFNNGTYSYNYSAQDHEIGDVLFIFSLGIYGDDRNEYLSGDWSQLFYYFDYATASILYRVINATDIATPVVNGGSSVASRGVVCVRGADLSQFDSTSQIIDDASILAESGYVDGQLQTPAITVSADNSLILSVGHAMWNSTLTPTGQTPPANLTQFYQFTHEFDGGNYHRFLGGEATANIGTFTPGAWTSSASEWFYRYTIAIAPL
jgi:hypothetical protein